MHVRILSDKTSSPPNLNKRQSAISLAGPLLIVFKLSRLLWVILYDFRKATRESSIKARISIGFNFRTTSQIKNTVN